MGAPGPALLEPQFPPSARSQPSTPRSASTPATLSLTSTSEEPVRTIQADSPPPLSPLLSPRSLSPRSTDRRRSPRLWFSPLTERDAAAAAAQFHGLGSCTTCSSSARAFSGARSRRPAVALRITGVRFHSSRGTVFLATFSSIFTVWAACSPPA